jgi:hypothetical protein
MNVKWHWFFEELGRFPALDRPATCGNIYFNKKAFPSIKIRRKSIDHAILCSCIKINDAAAEATSCFVSKLIEIQKNGPSMLLPITAAKITCSARDVFE